MKEKIINTIIKETLINLKKQDIIALPNAISYGLGWEHPFVYTIVVYILVWVIRLPFKKKKAKD